MFHIKDLDKVTNVPFFSTSDEVVLYPAFLTFIHERFPEPSSYEINQQDKIKQKKQELLKVIEIYKQKNLKNTNKEKRSWKENFNL